MKNCGEDPDKLCALIENIADHYQVCKFYTFHPNKQRAQSFHLFVCLFVSLLVFIIIIIIIIFFCVLVATLGYPRRMSCLLSMSPPTLCPQQNSSHGPQYSAAVGEAAEADQHLSLSTVLLPRMHNCLDLFI